MRNLGDFVRCPSTTVDADIARLQYQQELQRRQAEADRAASTSGTPLHKVPGEKV